MRKRLRYGLYTLSGIVSIALLTATTRAAAPPVEQLLPTFLFYCLTAFTMAFSIPLAGGSVSLMPMALAATYFVVGAPMTGWVIVVSAITHAILRLRNAESAGARQALTGIVLPGLTGFNILMHTAAISIGDIVFRALGGKVPLDTVDGTQIIALITFGVIYIVVNYVLAGVHLAQKELGGIATFLRSVPNLIFFEGGPMVFAPMTAAIYTHLGLTYFLFYALSLAISSLIAHHLGMTTRRLERRVKELDTLQAVGKTLSASLEIETVLWDIYTEVTKLMPAQVFYVALYEADSAEVTFPLVIEHGQRAHWPSVKGGRGLTEYVLQTQHPLLLNGKINIQLERLGVEPRGKEAACWLGTPLIAGNESLGVIALQSYESPDAYDPSHQEILTTIAVQAAVAIQNARLYARTDEALARRVQELDSILRTTSNGILLLDLNGNVMAVNRALAGLLDVSEPDLFHYRFREPHNGEPGLGSLLDYPPAQFHRDGAAILAGEMTQRQDLVVLGPHRKHTERTLTPVRDDTGLVTGWLFIFRDMTEEVELARLKNDTTNMLVHDLRSPLTLVSASLDLMEEAFATQNAEQFHKLAWVAKQGSDRILSMINQLLEISRLESGQMPVEYEWVDIAALINETIARFAPLATSVQIGLTVDIVDGIPKVLADPHLIRRVLNNLLDNAIKFTPNGGQVTIRARRDLSQDTPGARISISDTGPGIAPEDYKRLFTKFQQVTAIRGRRRGTGLGLAFCKLAVEAHAGQIWVESAPGAGSTFVFILPGVA
ncbi:MAG: GAF domain-containing protein [Anaerolineae bacterium]|nr:GAF domain-containing protein [Anaerolineae bacterium]